MSTNRSRRIDRDVAEQLLSGAADGRQAGPGALSDLLAAAAAPGTARELAGEEAAVAAFREAARLMPAQSALPALPPSHLIPVPETIDGRLRTCALPEHEDRRGRAHRDGPRRCRRRGRHREPARRAGRFPRWFNRRAPGPGHSAGFDGASGHPQARCTARSVRTSGSPRGPPGGALPGLAGCGYGRGGEKAPATADAKFAPLVRAAGGADRVRAYCASCRRLPGSPRRRARRTAIAPHSPNAADRTIERASTGSRPSRAHRRRRCGPGFRNGRAQRGQTGPGRARQPRADPGKPDPGHRPQSPTAATAADGGQPTR